MAYGLRRGAIPAMRWSLVFTIAFLASFTFYETLAPRLQTVFRKMPEDWVQGLSFIMIELVVLAVLVVPMLMHSHETVPIRKQFDRLFGLAFGVATGLLLSGLLIISFMSLPFGRRAFAGNFDWYVPAHRLMLRGYGFLTRTGYGTGRPFVEEQVVRDLEWGRPRMPVGDRGLWVSSIPLGLRVYIDQTTNKSITEWKKRDLEGLLGKNLAPATPGGREGRREKRLEGYVGRTPLLVSVEAEEVLVAVEMVLPKDMTAEQDSPFLWDGEEGWFTTSVFRERVVVRIYRVRPNPNTDLRTCIAAFVPRDADEEARAAWYDRKLAGGDPMAPVVKAEAAVSKLATITTTQAAEERWLPWLRRGGKVCLEKADTGEIVVLELTPDGDLKELRKPAGYRLPAIP